MTVQIDSMQTQVEVVGRGPAGGGAAAPTSSSGTSSGGTSSGVLGQEALKELLRPLVLELFSEELTTYMRMRG